MENPNVILPLASSYNERGIAGYTSTFTNALDQRKVNSVYRAVKNAITGGQTLYLCKRPGVAIDGGNNSFGTTGQVAYLNSLGAANFGTGVTGTWVYSTSGSDVRASSSAATTVVVSAANNVPLYVDKTSISGNDTVVLQVGSAAETQTVWYSTTIGTWTQITDSDFPDVVGKMEFIDGWALAAMDSSNVQRIYNSDINSLANWTSTNFITKQIQQDRLVGLMRLGNLIIGAGQNTLEIFRNAGNVSGSPLESIQQLATHGGVNSNMNAPYYCTIGKRIFYFGRAGDTLSNCVNTFNGSNVETVSTPNIEAIISQASVLRGMFTIHFQGRYAVAISLAAQNAATQHWLMFFPDYNEWFEWTSTVFSPIQTRGGWFLGVGSNQHKLYNFVSSDLWQDNGTDYSAVHQFVLPDKGNQRKFMNFCALKGDTARSALSITVEASDDDMQTWSTLGTIDMSTKLKQLTRCGSWQGQRAIRLTNAANMEGRLQAFLARVE